MGSKFGKIAGVLSLIAGLLLIVTAGVTWGMISSQLKDEQIIVAKDADMFAGKLVAGPFTAYSEAEIIKKHALAGTDGLTYAELGDKANEAKAAGDTEAEAKFRQQRTTAMNASFLRASLFTSVLAFGVAAMAGGIGIILLIIGYALMKLSDAHVHSAGTDTTVVSRS